MIPKILDSRVSALRAIVGSNVRGAYSNAPAWFGILDNPDGWIYMHFLGFAYETREKVTLMQQHIDSKCDVPMKAILEKDPEGNWRVDFTPKLTSPHILLLLGDDWDIPYLTRNAPFILRQENNRFGKFLSRYAFYRL